MIGSWTKFGEGEPPAEGEMVAFVLAMHDDIEGALYGGYRALEVAVHRSSSLHCQDGSVIAVPWGCWWTSLPPQSARK